MTGPIQVKGTEYVPAAAMPGLKTNAVFGDAQLADVATFVRFAWGNKKGAVQPATIAGVRKQLQGRDAAFSGTELRARFSK